MMMIAAIGTNVPNTIVAVEILRGGFGGGVGHHAGSEKSSPTAAIVTDNVRVQALAAAALAVLVLAPASAASTTLSYTFKTRQGAVSHQAHPPAGGVGDTYSSRLVLRNAGLAQLGAGRHASVGSMRLQYTLRKQCAAFTRNCVATADFVTVTVLPGGKVLAAGKRISISSPNIKIPVTGGTGRFQGARGWVTISPSSTQISTYQLTVPRG
jgi:hypothetical protein